MTKIPTLIKAICFAFANLFVFSFCAYAAGSCSTLKEYINEGTGDNFILKEGYEIIARAATSVAKFSWDNFATPLQAVVGLGTAIYIAVYTLRNIGSFSQQDTAAYLSNDKTGVIPLAVKMAIVVWLLGNQAFIYKYLIGLAITTCVEVGNLIGPNSGIGNFDSPDNLEDLFNFVIQQVIDFNDSIYKIVATGQLLLCMAIPSANFFRFYWTTIPFAAALWIYGWLIIIGVSFYMLDVLFRLGVGCIVLPFAVACGLSKLTIDYTRKTWNLFINVCFSFIMLGILISFTFAMISRCVGLDIPENKVLNEADIKHINDNLDLGVFFITAICSMISLLLFMQLESIVEKVSGTEAVSKVGQQTGKQFSKSALRVASKPIRELGNFAGAGGQVIGKGVKNYVHTVRRNISNKIKSSRPYRIARAATLRSGVGRSYRAVRKFLRWDER